MRSRGSKILEDWSSNSRNPRAQFVLAFFRLAHLASSWGGWLYVPGRIIGVAYRLVVEWVLGIELPWRTDVGPRVRLFHGVGLVINDACRIGADVVLRQGVTIGHKRAGSGSPVIEDRVEFGAGAVVIGDITIGHDSIIGPGAVVTESLPPFSIAKAAPPLVRLRVNAGGSAPRVTN